MALTDKSDEGWRWWLKLFVPIAAPLLAGMGFLKPVGDWLIARGGSTVGTLFAALAPAVWPSAVGLTVYWALKRQIHRTPTLTSDPATEDINWAQTFNVFRVEMHQPTFRVKTEKLTAKFYLWTVQRVPDGTKVVEWQVRFNFQGQVLEKWNHKERDIHLATVGQTELWPAPEVNAPAFNPDQPPTVSCEVFCQIRVPGLNDYVKVTTHTYGQVCFLM